MIPIPPDDMKIKKYDLPPIHLDNASYPRKDSITPPTPMPDSKERKRPMLEEKRKRRNEKQKTKKQKTK